MQGVMSPPVGWKPPSKQTPEFKVSRISCALLLILVLGMLTDIQVEVLHREKRALPAWIVVIAARICGKPAAAGAERMWDAYQDMRRAGRKNCDKYFHCRGNYEAAQTGWCGRLVAAAVSNAREWAQGGGAEGAADKAANRYGRSGGNCAKKYILDTRGKCRMPKRLW